MSVELYRSPEDTFGCALADLVKAYGEDVLLDISGTLSSSLMTSLDGLRLAFRALSSSLVGGVGMPDDLAFSRSGLEALLERCSFCLVTSELSIMSGS